MALATEIERGRFGTTIVTDRFKYLIQKAHAMWLKKINLELDLSDAPDEFKGNVTRTITLVRC
jgi:hypothetical protein